jgi:threonyl-tRNA synthetase
LDTLLDAGIRAVALDGAETLSRRIAAAHEAGIPVMAIIGRKEAGERSVALRERNGNQMRTPLPEALASLKARASGAHAAQTTDG